MDGKSITLCAHTIDGLASEFENFTCHLDTLGITYTAISLPLRTSDGTIYVRSSGSTGRLVFARRLRGLVARSLGDIFFTRHGRDSVVWIGFNPVALLASGFLRRRVFRVLWSIDFVPWQGSRLRTFGYSLIQRLAVRRADLLIENNSVALDARLRAAGLDPASKKRSIIVPISVDLDLYAPLPRSGGLIVGFLGSLSERTGADRLISVFEEIAVHLPDAKFEVIGGGPLLDLVRSQATHSPVSNSIDVLGFIESEEKVASHVNRWTAGLALFPSDERSWTRFADPQKLRLYLAAGAIPVTTSVPPSAAAIQENGLGIVVPPDASDELVGHLVGSLLSDHSALESLCAAIERYRPELDRRTLYARVVDVLST